ncbi:hypothetical protein GCM10007216_01710 [Thalassobacillus devorans]|uniref:DUF3231 family protein n=1 Tax=Thalassobacillus devorans TaxID=279813 RepID=A0ABQ1NMD2_9BACI|nr:DUF3231 family protein [Thalassobacillus devorans]NIK27080.1 putative N-acetylmannosamine-6-phosphate epimerase [Thalassobacillus devorans]GGC74768.1 hypothetical protein GCM10007216_01710 [Thalassobacillus devorans]
MKRHKHEDHVQFTNQLTSAEMGKLWAAYQGNTMGKCVLSYFLRHLEDAEIKKVVEGAVDLTNTFIRDIKRIFDEVEFPLPIGFTEEDVNLEAPRLFYDEFYLHYLRYLAKAGTSIYSAATPIMTRKDTRDFFVESLKKTTKLMTDVHDVLAVKGALGNDPAAPSPAGIDFVNRQSFLHGYFGEVRPLHGMEVAHLYDNLHNDITSKALILGFSQGARNRKVTKFLNRGRKINVSHIDKFTNKLKKDNIAAPGLLDHLVTPSTVPPFSDKLMVFHKIDMFSMKIRNYANGASLNGRKDIGALYARCLLDVSLYVEDGANIMIDNGWMEQPPIMIDRDQLSSYR